MYLYMFAHIACTVAVAGVACVRLSYDRVCASSCRAVWEWDLRPAPVCHRVAALIDSNIDKPLLCLSALNPALFDTVRTSHYILLAFLTCACACACCVYMGVLFRVPCFWLIYIVIVLPVCVCVRVLFDEALHSLS